MSAWSQAYGPDGSHYQYQTAMPTLVMPREWSVPSYLKHSAFYDRFTVSPSSSPAQAIPAPAASTSSTSLRLGVAARPGQGAALPAAAHPVHQPTLWEQHLSETWTSRDRAGQPSSTSAGVATTSGSGVGSSTAITAQDSYQQRLNSSRSVKIQLPSMLDPKHCCKRLLIQDELLQFCPEKDDNGKDKLNRSDPDKDAAAVRADHPIPPQTGIYYYEVEILSKGQKGYIGIGFSSRSVDLERLPGWNPESYGYHGDDGKAFACSGTGQNYSERFGSGDVIGCGIDFVAKRAFFVKNGKWLGYVFNLANALGEREDPTLKPGYGSSTGSRSRDRERGKMKETPGTAPLQLYPTIGLQTPGESVRVNFGQEKFRFDIESFVKRRQREVTAEVLAHTIPMDFKRSLAPTFPHIGSTSPSALVDSSLDTTRAADIDDPHLTAALQNLVASYLNYRGYADTARSFRRQRQDEAKQWQELIAQSSASMAADLAANGEPESSSVAVSGSSTPAKAKKTKKKGEASSKKLLKSALRTTLPTAEEGEDSVMEAGNESARLAADQSEDMEMADVAQNTPALRDDYLLTDAAAKRRTIEVVDDGEAELADALRRHKVCAAIRRGDIDFAIQQLETHYEGVLQSKDAPRSSTQDMNGTSNGHSVPSDRKPDLLFELSCRKFVELMLACAAASESQTETIVEADGDCEEDEDMQVASQLLPAHHSSSIAASTTNEHAQLDGKGKGKASADRPPATLDEVLEYGAHLNSLYPASDPSVAPATLARLKLIFSLIAYANPADLLTHGNRDIHALTRQEERDELAETINKAMLESKGQPGIPHLELVYKQASTARDVLGDVFGDGSAALLGDVVNA